MCRSLLCAVANGNEAAFAVLYDRYCDVTWQTCVRFATHPVTPEAAMIDLWVYVWEYASDLAREDSDTGAVINQVALRMLWGQRELTTA